MSTSQEAMSRSMLREVRVWCCNRCGTWQERAAAITELQRLGFRMEELYEVAFVAGTTQTTMVVAGQVSPRYGI